jgi:hypothetical protein
MIRRTSDPPTINTTSLCEDMNSINGADFKPW